jgi:hypothetical protein
MGRACGVTVVHVDRKAGRYFSLTANNASFNGAMVRAELSVVANPIAARPLPK